MTNLNINFLMSGRQFSDKLNENKICNQNTNELKKCVWSAKNSKSNNYYQIKQEIKKLKDLTR